MSDDKIQYPTLNPMKLEPYYCRHVEAMTVEGLHEKSDIAIQLAWRDKRIDGVHEVLNEWQSYELSDDARRLVALMRAALGGAEREPKCDQCNDTGKQRLFMGAAEIPCPHCKLGEAAREPR